MNVTSLFMINIDLHQHFPTETDLSVHSQTRLNTVARPQNSSKPSALTKIRIRFDYKKRHSIH